MKIFIALATDELRLICFREVESSLRRDILFFLHQKLFCLSSTKEQRFRSCV